MYWYFSYSEPRARLVDLDKVGERPALAHALHDAVELLVRAPRDRAEEDWKLEEMYHTLTNRRHGE